MIRRIRDAIRRIRATLREAEAVGERATHMMDQGYPQPLHYLAAGPDGTRTAGELAHQARAEYAREKARRAGRED